MKLSKILFVIFIAGNSFFCQDIVEQKCQSACDQFITCTEQELKLELSVDVKRTGRIQCMDGCTTHNTDILQCYDEEPTSCKGFGECLKQIGTFE